MTLHGFFPNKVSKRRGRSSIFFSALLYGKQSFEMIEVFLFPGDLESLKYRHPVDVHVITDINRHTGTQPKNFVYF